VGFFGLGGLIRFPLSPVGNRRTKDELMLTPPFLSVPEFARGANEAGAENGKGCIGGVV
jgi:hypothetical protein